MKAQVMSFKVQPKGLSTKRKRLISFQQLNKSWAIQNDQKMNSTMIWNNYFNGSEGEQNIPPQNMPPWHADYFELKVIKTEQTQKKVLPLS